jgi:hypothetical protein
VMRHAAATGHVHAATGLGPPQSADARLGARPLPPAAVGPSR